MRHLLSFLPVVFSVFFSLSALAQPTLGVLSGTVKDSDSDQPVPFASIVLSSAHYSKGLVAGETGDFRFDNLPIGRYDLLVSFIGFEPSLISNIEVGSGKMAVVEVRLKESLVQLGEVTVVAEEQKGEAIDKMAMVSARQLSMDEARRYAGGFDDPARLVSGFAGVASNVSSNGIVIRGNSPRGLLWRLEGVPIPNPNHFADLAGYGSGAITALSSQMLASSDFFTGAFPAEYGNASSGVFDLHMRNGNNQQRENTFQLGVIGIDAASEGPLGKDSQASYLFNYRYSTLGLILPILPDETGGITYQDFAFKLHFPGTKYGSFSVWGLGLADTQNSEALEDSTQWKYYSDKYGVKSSLSNGVIGFSHRLFTDEKSYLHSTLALTGDRLASREYFLDSDLESVLDADVKFRSYNAILSSVYNRKFSARHTVRAGVVYTAMGYNFVMLNTGASPWSVASSASDEGLSLMWRAFAQHSLALSPTITANPGLSFQYYGVNGDAVLEPRASLKWAFTPGQSLALAYGKHSQIEKLHFYFERIGGDAPENRLNRDVKAARAHHLVLAYDRKVSELHRLKIEPYYQWLTRVPVVRDSSFSFLNLEYHWFIGAELDNSGEGRNVGVDFTLERFLDKGWYYLLTASVFDSRYKGGDGIWRNTRYNQGLIANALFGREWSFGKEGSKTLQASVRYTFMGGARMNPVLEGESIVNERIIEDFDRAFSQKAPARNLVHLALNYSANHRTFKGTWSLQVLNALGDSEYFGKRYNFRDGRLDEDREVLIIPNLSYKVEF